MDEIAETKRQLNVYVDIRTAPARIFDRTSPEQNRTQNEPAVYVSGTAEYTSK